MSPHHPDLLGFVSWLLAKMTLLSIRIKEMVGKEPGGGQLRSRAKEEHKRKAVSCMGKLFSVLL